MKTKYQIYKDELNRLLQKTQTGGGWYVKFAIDNDLGGDAACEYSLMGRWVKFSFNSKQCKNYPASEVKLCARHEFGHFVVARLERLAAYRWTTENEIREECECIARVFERMG